ncbi:MAG TPA: hypothetical protein VGV39_00150 [Mesorhizobium sp.]|jgi:hypothetical protein|uniref:hypothetical protein n=1 Tax=Mesorhizobium sp. TaxID=1871066 RepID=UPI002DDD4E5D|nr:hypothetical protein [Mesorhizobium sp.]HEV2501451.1 hypothetical protein [Mesorhizobium sp.]
MLTHVRSGGAMPRPIASSLADKPGHRASSQVRPDHPAGEQKLHHRAVELADMLRELTGADGGASEAELRSRGFTMAEIVEHLPSATLIVSESWVRRVDPPGDRVPDIVTKALAAASHNMPKTAGLDPEDEDIAAGAWRRYCTARAAWKLDPWVSQGERCLKLLEAFLSRLPLLERERNRVVYALAAQQKIEGRPAQ